MIIRGSKEIDALYALFLGRLPENNQVRENNFGRDALETTKEFIESEEFQTRIVDCACQDSSLPHRTLSLEHLQNALDFIAESGLAPASEGPTPVDWQGLLWRVLTAAPCRGIVEARYGERGQQLIDVLAEAPPLAQPSVRELDRDADPLIVSGVDIIASTICRGWVIDRNEPRALLHIKVKVNGRTARIIPADEFRRDVQDLYGGEGRAGFSVHLDMLRDAPYLARACVEIVELSQGVVVLPERFVEFGAGSAGQSEAEIREELMHLRKAIDRLEASLPRLLHSQNWALALYNAVQSRLDLVIAPPAVDTPVGFSVVVIDNPKRPGAAKETLASVLAQTREPCEVMLVVPGDSPRGLVPKAGAESQIRAPRGRALFA